MVSKTLFILFCLMIFNCSSMVEALQCHKKALVSWDKTAVRSEGNETCREDQDICIYYVQYLKNITDQTHSQPETYNHECKKNSTLAGLTFPLNRDDNHTCGYSNTTHQLEIVCKCNEDMCNGYDTNLHRELIELYQNWTGTDLKLDFNFTATTVAPFTTTEIGSDYQQSPGVDPVPTNVGSAGTDASSPDGSDGKPEDASASHVPPPDIDIQIIERAAAGETTTSGTEVKQFWIILCFVMMIYSIIFV